MNQKVKLIFSLKIRGEVVKSELDTFNGPQPIVHWFIPCIRHNIHHFKKSASCSSQVFWGSAQLFCGIRLLQNQISWGLKWYAYFAVSNLLLKVQTKLAVKLVPLWYLQYLSTLRKREPNNLIYFVLLNQDAQYAQDNQDIWEAREARDNKDVWEFLLLDI